METQTTVFKQLFDLSGQVALITGAGVGFGEAISLGFAEFGCDIAACDLTLENPKRTSERVRALGRRSIALTANVSVPEDIFAMVDATVKEFGRLDIHGEDIFGHRDICRQRDGSSTQRAHS